VTAQSEGEMSGQVEIIINLISSIMFSILAGVSYRYLYLPYRRRTNVLSRLSPLDFTSDPVYLCYGLIPLRISNDPKGLILSRPGGSQEIFLNSYRKSGDPEVSSV
jgi:hypothetical protein